MNKTKNLYVKSPLNYVGGKHKLLPQIEPLFPKDIRLFIDMFGGGGNVAANVQAEAIVYNEKQQEVQELLRYMYIIPNERFLSELKQVIDYYQLSKTNLEGYLALRQDYNQNKTPIKFYALITHSFNNSIRFNNKGEFNIPFGKNRSGFNSELEKKLKIFQETIQQKKMVFLNKDFRDVNIEHLSNKDFVYLDPPYLIAVAAYNANGGWTEKDEVDLYELCDKLHRQGVKFAVSNVTYHKGKQNNILIEWSKKYNVYHLNYSYGNSYYCTKDKSKNGSQEVLVTNYTFNERENPLL